MSTQSGTVTLDAASQRDAVLFSNLIELYVHDLSAIFDVEIGEDGRFGYEHLPRYWDEPDRRFAFLIRAGGRLAGFALVTRGSPATSDPMDLDVAEFFILRKWRGSGIGRLAARLLWDRLPGTWVVRVSEMNQPGLKFWEPVIRVYTLGAFRMSTVPGKVHTFRVFSFASGAGTGDASP
jgi:predicted acetyltransferase